MVITRLGGATRDTQRSRSGGQRQADVLVQDDDRPMLDRKATEGLLDLVAIRAIPSAIRSRWLQVDRLYGRLEPPPATEFIRHGMHEDPVQPPIEPIDVAEFRQLPPAAHQRFLNSVLGKVRVAQDEPGDRMKPIDLARGELAEGFPVAAPRSVDEFLPHRVPWFVPVS